MNLSRRTLLATLLPLLASAALTLSLGARADTPHVTLKTNMGSIVLELYPDKAPKSVANFLQYVKNGQYNGTIFHRVIEGFMIQGGGFDQDMHEKPTGAPIENEAKNGLKNSTYSLAMARTQAPHSATAQFFINTANNTALDYPSRDGWGYAVFGKVIDGKAIIDQIKQVKTGNRGMYQDVPLTPVIIEAATLSK